MKFKILLIMMCILVVRVNLYAQPPISLRFTSPPIANLYSPEANHELFLVDAYLLWLESGSITNPLNTIQVIKSYGNSESEIRFDNGDEMLAAIYTISNDRSLNFVIGGIFDGGMYSVITLENKNSVGDMKVHLRAEAANESALVFHNASDSDTSAYMSKIYRPSSSNDLVINFNGIGDVMTFDSTDGNVGIGIANPSQKLHVMGNVSADNYLYNSSREYKEQIESLTSDKAISALNGLRPVTFKYKNDNSENHVGFIAEEVPELIAKKDRKGLSPMDIVAVLTKVVQQQQKKDFEQSRIIEQQKKTVEQQQKRITKLTERLNNLEREVKLKSRLASVVN
jgi:hypothetical protein